MCGTQNWRGKMERDDPESQITSTSNNNNIIFHNRNDINSESRHSLPSGKEAKCIKIDGYIYDISNFIPYHPGGNIIEHFVDCEASDVFHSFHDKNVLKFRKPVGTYTRQIVDRDSKAFSDLHKFFVRNGFFKTNYRWYAMKIVVTFSFLATAVFLITICDAWYLHYLGALALALFWHQCGFFMHDFLHSQGTRDRKLDTLLGIFFGTVCFGISGRWWKDEHFVHHALTCCVDYDTKFSDPQMKEPIWAQNEKLFPFFTTYLESIAIRVQHITFLPVCFMAGRVGVMIDSFKNERRLKEWVAFIIHWACVIYILSYLPSWGEMFVVFLFSNCFMGLLLLQLLLSHYCKPFYFKKDVGNEQNWYRMQVESNMNIVCPRWLDWFHGGLNFHIEHHLFPTMPRYNFREASRHIRRVSEELGIDYDECSFSMAVIKTLKHLKTTSKLFRLDPR